MLFTSNEIALIKTAVQPVKSAKVELCELTQCTWTLHESLHAQEFQKNDLETTAKKNRNRMKKLGSVEF